MRMFLLIGAVVGSAALTSGQTLGGRQMMANTIERTSPTTVQLRGRVEITQGTTRMTADEADMRTGANGAIEYDLRGNVHITIRDSN